MNIIEAAFLTDENISPVFFEYLKSKNFNVKNVVELQLNGQPDEEVLRISQIENRVIITQDSDFGRLVKLDKIPFTGIIYLRPGHISASFHIQTFEAILEAVATLNPPFILVAENKGNKIKIRMR